jgi:chloramphenicol-sensitive protein RarD
VTSVEDRETSRSGIAYGLGAYGIWGLVPLFWVLLDRASAFEILAHRMIWSFVFAVILSLIMLPRGWLAKMLTRRKLIMLGLASLAVSINWGIFIWATTNGHVTEVALGYYINPIVSILLGVIVLRERLRRWQWVAVGLAGVAVVVLTIELGRLPWIALSLAIAFGAYGLIKNRVRGGAVETLVIESTFQLLPALGYVIFLQAFGTATFIDLGLTHSLLLAAGGLVTLVPLLLFSAAATRIPLSTLGLLQYITPTLQFILGVTFFGEAMPVGRWIGFGLVWIALIILTTGMVLTMRRPPIRSSAAAPDSSDRVGEG